MQTKKTKKGSNKTQMNKRPIKFFKKSCVLCAKGIYHIDYKDVELLNDFIANNGRILPRRITGLCAKHQKMVTNAIKRARIVALMPFIKE